MLKISENSNFLPIKSDKVLISTLFSTVLYMGPYFFETIFPLTPSKKFILFSGFDKKIQTNPIKSFFFGFGYLQFLS